jgi:hypothetical protein
MNRKVSLLSGFVLSIAASALLAEPIVMNEPIKLIEQQMDSVTAAGTAVAGAAATGVRASTRTSARVNNAVIATGLGIGIGENSSASADAYTSGSKSIINTGINMKIDGRVHVNLAVSGSLR